MKASILRECLRIAAEKEARLDESFRHFSFVVQRNRVVEWGTNKTADPLTRRGFPSYGKLHAETEAYRKARGVLTKDVAFEMVNVRIKNGAPKLSAPCPCCAEFLRSCGCSAVWFSTEAGFARL